MENVVNISEPQVLPNEMDAKINRWKIELEVLKYRPSFPYINTIVTPRHMPDVYISLPASLCIMQH